MNRRQMIKGSLVTGTAIGIGGPAVLLETACAPKNLSLYVQTVVGALDEVKPLLPSAAGLIVKAVAVANDFDKAYKAGQFANATTLFANLSDLIGQIANDTGVNNSTIRVGLAVAGIAMRAIAVLLKAQATEPAVAAAVRGRARGGLDRSAELIERLANDAAVDQIFRAAKP